MGAVEVNLPVDLGGLTSLTTGACVALANDELTPAEAAEVLGVSAATVRRWEERGILAPSRRLPGSRHRRYARADVEAAKRRIEAGDFDGVDPGSQ